MFLSPEQLNELTGLRQEGDHHSIAKDFCFFGNFIHRGETPCQKMRKWMAGPKALKRASDGLPRSCCHKWRR